MKRTKKTYKKGHEHKTAQIEAESNDFPSSDPHTETTEKFPIKLYIWDFHQCNPKICTGAKLKRAKYVQNLTATHSFKGVILTPEATIT